MRSARVIFCFLLLAFGFLIFPHYQAAAQTPTTTSTTLPYTNSFNTPNMDPDVPRNQHTFAQATTIEVLSAIHCLLTGIDPVSPSQGCLGINTDTERIGISKPPVDEYGRAEASGLVGTTTGLITSTLQPIASTGVYTQYITDNFGIVTKAHAQGPPCDPATSGYGFCGLQPVLKLWEAVRNVAYSLLTLAFIFIGVGIMLRVKIDPRTVMTIQNQIPKVIISIILITFSYAISAILIDMMWVTTYAGSYLLTANHDPVVGDCTKQFNKDPNDKAETLSKKISTTILQTPITFFNSTFADCKDETNPIVNENDRNGGFHVMTNQIANNFGNVIGNVGRDLIFGGNREEDCGYNPIKCFKKGIKTTAINALEVIISLVAKIIIFVILVITLFKIWFNLLKAFIYTLVYVILGPIIIVFGLLPTKPMGFEAWIRRLFVNIAVFPITVFLFVAARLLLDLYDNKATDQFVPPLVGNPIDTNFGALMAFGVLLIAPTIQTILREKMGVKNIGTPGIVAAGIAGGAAVVGAPVNRAVKHMSRSDPRTGDYGVLARAKQQTGAGVIGVGKFIPGLKGMSERALKNRESLKETGYTVERAKEIYKNRTPLDENERDATAARGAESTGVEGSTRAGSTPSRISRWRESRKNRKNNNRKGDGSS